MLYTVYNLEQEHLKNKNLLATFWVGHENKALFCFHHKLTENGSGD